MPFDENRANRIARNNEFQAARVFKEMGYVPLFYKPTKAHKTPDLVITDSSGGLLCLVEVKTLVSGGYHPDDGTHHSTLDPGMWNQTRRRVPVTPLKANDLLSEAAGQYRSAVEFRPELRGLPFIVAFYFHTVADTTVVCREGLALFPEISAVVREAQDQEFWEAFWAEPYEKQMLRERTGNFDGLPRRQHRWRILTNTVAATPLPDVFIERCLPTTSTDELGMAG